MVGILALSYFTSGLRFGLPFISFCVLLTFYFTSSWGGSETWEFEEMLSLSCDRDMDSEALSEGVSLSDSSFPSSSMTFGLFRTLLMAAQERQITVQQQKQLIPITMIKMAATEAASGFYLN